MTEKLLQHIWRHQYFNRQSLQTTAGESLQIINPGQLNSNQGPDFDEGRIQIGDTTWAGNIEVHILASDYNRHNHQQDERYQKIILHVVWLNDQPIYDKQGNFFPTIELQPRVSNHLLQRFDQWMSTTQQIPCGAGINQVNNLSWQKWLETALIERLMEKTNHIQHLLKLTKNHWEEVLWIMTCRYFGGNINGTSFEQIALSLPLQLLAKHKNQIHQLEALLIGQAGLLHRNFEEDYPQMLFREYQFLQKKYQLRVVNLPPSFLRMRPQNFPTIRLAQLAMLIQQSIGLFAQIKEAQNPADFKKAFNVTANDYWHYHYRFDEMSTFSQKTVGDKLFNTLLINAIVPVLFSYAVAVNQPSLKEKTLDWLTKTSFEKNHQTNPFLLLGIKAASAFESQALIQLKKHYCDAKRCLECAVGNQILRESGLERS